MANIPQLDWTIRNAADKRLRQHLTGRPGESQKGVDAGVLEGYGAAIQAQA